MRRIVLDASAFLSWFGPNGTGRTLRAEYEAGLLAVRVPSPFTVHVLDLARARSLDSNRLERLASELERVGFEFQDPAAAVVVHWLAKGLDATRAPYAALAAENDLRLVSDDEETLRIATALAERPG